jgi:hypothetical protein
VEGRAVSHGQAPQEQALFNDEIKQVKGIAIDLLLGGIGPA